MSVAPSRWSLPVTQWIGASKWVPVCSPSERLFQYPPGPPQARRGDREPGGAEPLPEQIEAAARLYMARNGDTVAGRKVELIVKDDAFITGFEGEAGRTLAQRRRKMPAARDVAGLIHSIDAAAAAALERALKLAPDDRGRLALRLGEWRDRSVEACIHGYRGAMADIRLWPDDPWGAQQAIDFGVEFPFVKDSDGSAAKALGVERTPEAVVLDAKRVCAIAGESTISSGWEERGPNWRATI